MGRLITEPAIPKTGPAAGTRRTARQPVAYTSEVVEKLDRSDQKVQFGPNADEMAWLRLPKYLVERFQSSNHMGCSKRPTSRGWKAEDAIEWFHGIGRLEAQKKQPGG